MGASHIAMKFAIKTSCRSVFLNLYFRNSSFDFPSAGPGRQSDQHMYVRFADNAKTTQPNADRLNGIA